MEASADVGFPLGDFDEDMREAQEDFLNLVGGWVRTELLRSAEASLSRKQRRSLKKDEWDLQEVANLLEQTAPELDVESLIRTEARKGFHFVKRDFMKLSPPVVSPALLWTLAGDQGPVWSCAISPDGSFIASGGQDGAVRIWDTATGEQRAALLGHTGIVTGCAVIPDGTEVVSASFDGTIKIWELATGLSTTLSAATPLPPVVGAILGEPAESRALIACALSRDGALVVTGGADGSLKIWDMAERTHRITLEGHGGAVWGCAVSPDESFIVSASRDKTLRIWDAATGEERAVLEGHADEVNACAISPDASVIVSAGADHVVKTWDVASGAERASLAGHQLDVHACAVSADGSYIVSGSSDESLKIWATLTGELLATLEGHMYMVMDCAISADSSLIVSASLDRTVRVWDVQRALHDV